MNCDIEIVATTEDALFKQVATLIEESRKHVAKAVNTAMVYTYYGVGQYIVDYEQGGNYRAAYGKGVLARLSAKLTNKYGRGWSVETLTKCRKFYNIYAISSAPQTESTGKANSSDGQTKSVPEFTLSWNHYQILMRIENPEERHFYEIEAQRQNWGYKWLQRQHASSLYERIALSQVLQNKVR